MDQELMIDNARTQATIQKLRNAPPMRTVPTGTITTQAPVESVEWSAAPYYKSHAPSSADIFSMCMESHTADEFAKWLCHCAGVPFPPINEGVIV